MPAITRAAKVLALNSCSAYRFSDVCMARTQPSEGLSPCSRCRKCPPMESSCVSTAMRRPELLKWYQYSSMLPSDASSRSAMSRLPARLWSSFSGRAQPRADTPVRITSMGWLAAGSCSRAAFTLPGRPRSARSRAL